MSPAPVVSITDALRSGSQLQHGMARSLEASAGKARLCGDFAGAADFDLAALESEVCGLVLDQVLAAHERGEGVIV